MSALPVPTDLVAYVRQRHHMVATACALADHLNIPTPTEEIDPARSFEALPLVWATTVPQRLLDLYAQFGLQRYQEVRAVIAEHGLEQLAVVEGLIARDLDLFRSALTWRHELPAAAVDIVETAFSADYRDAIFTYAPKLVAALPLVVLLAWEDEWLSALRALDGVYGGINTPTSSMAEEYLSRLERVEADVLMVRRQLDGAGALLRAESPA